MNDPSVPFEWVIWSAEQCAAYLGVEVKVFYRMQHKDGFPPRLPKPGHPRWNALAVTQWAHGITLSVRSDSATV